jgi:hypothetical protein
MQHIEEDLLDQYAMGTLPAESIQHLEEHLLACKLCQARLMETDEFLPVFKAAATQPDARPWPKRKRGVLFPASLWAGAAAVVGLTVILIAWPHQAKDPTPATVMMQSLRGAESEARMASAKPVLLVFDLPVEAAAPNYEIEVVDTVGNEVLKTRAELRNGQLTGRFGKLAAGSYWVRLYRTQPARELVAEYGLRSE